MIRPVLAWFVASLALGGAAAADPVATKVVLAEHDPELQLALASSLRPWHIEVVVEQVAPADLVAARVRADDRAAQFVVWRDGDQLVVYDRHTEQAEHRLTSAGAFDAVNAAAAALTVKTMMRLPPIDEPAAVAVAGLVVPPESPPRGVEIRVELGAGSLYERGLASDVALRFAAAAALRPWRDRGWRFGVAGDVGTSTDVDQAGFKGTWSDFAVLGTASWALARDRWDGGPWIAVGAEHSALDGAEMQTARSEHATLLALRAGGAAHYRVGFLTIGAVVGLDTLAGTQTYTKTSSPAQVFEIPPFGVVAELFVGADLVP